MKIDQPKGRDRSESGHMNPLSLICLVAITNIATAVAMRVHADSEQTTIVREVEKDKAQAQEKELEAGKKNCDNALERASQAVINMLGTLPLKLEEEIDCKEALRANNKVEQTITAALLDCNQVVISSGGADDGDEGLRKAIKMDEPTSLATIARQRFAKLCLPKGSFTPPPDAGE